METDRELEELRKKRMMQAQQQAQQQNVDPQAAYQQERANEEREAQKQALLRQILTPEARERLATLKMSRGAMVEQLEMQLIGLAQNGQINGMIDDAALKQLLRKMQPKKRETTITRI